MPREVLSLHVGQAGCVVGYDTWDLFYKELGLLRNGRGSMYSRPSVSENESVSKVSTFFYEQETGIYKPRAVFVDTDPLVVDRMPDWSTMFDRDDVLVYRQDCRSNYFEGIFQSNQNSIAVATSDRIRCHLERCDSVSGFLVYRAIGGGTGAGVGNALLETIREDFGTKKVVIEPILFPSTSSSTCTVEPYNSIFALARSHSTVSLSLPLDNQAAFRICESRLGILNPSFSEMNKFIAQVVSRATSSLRLPSTLNASLDEIVTNIVPTPTFRYGIVSMCPPAMPDTLKSPSYTTSELVTRLFDSCSFLCDSIDLRKSRYFAASIICQGRGISAIDVQKGIQTIKHGGKLKLKGRAVAGNGEQGSEGNDSKCHTGLIKTVPWVPNSFKVGIVSSSSPSSASSYGLMLANSTSVRALFVRAYKKFLNLFYHRSYVWQFMEAGGEIDDFYQVKEQIKGLIEEYQRVGLLADEEDRDKLAKDTIRLL